MARSKTALRGAGMPGVIATEAGERRVDEIAEAVLYRPRHFREEEARRVRVVGALKHYVSAERDELVGQALARGFAEDPDACKVFVRDTLGTSIDSIARDLNLTRDTTYRWKWRAASIILHHLEDIVREQQATP